MAYTTAVASVPSLVVLVAAGAVCRVSRAVVDMATAGTPAGDTGPAAEMYYKTLSAAARALLLMVSNKWEMQSGSINLAHKRVAQLLHLETCQLFMPEQ